MTVVLLVEGARPHHLVVSTSVLAELGAALHALTEADHHGTTRGWRAEVRGKLDDWLAAEVERYAPLWAAYRTRVLYPPYAEVAADFEAELRELAHLPLDTFVRLVGFGCAGGYTGLRQASTFADAAGQAELRAAAQARSTARLELADDLLNDPAGFRRRFLDFLSACHASFFAATWVKIEPQLQQAAAAMRDRLRRESMGEVLASLSGTAETLADPPRVVLDKFHHGVVNVARQGLTLLPSWYCWPHLLVKHETGLPPVVQFPAAWHRGLRPAEVRQRLSALNEPGRLRLCRLIAREPLSTLSLATMVGMTEPQVSRHLRKLREAGLVRAERSGRFVYYTLDVDEVARLGSDVLTALLH